MLGKKSPSENSWAELESGSGEELDSKAMHRRSELDGAETAVNEVPAISEGGTRTSFSELDSWTGIGREAGRDKRGPVEMA